MGLEGQCRLVIQTFLFWTIPPLPFVDVVAVILGQTYLVVVLAQLGELCKCSGGSVHHGVLWCTPRTILVLSTWDCSSKCTH